MHQSLHLIKGEAIPLIDSRGSKVPSFDLISHGPPSNTKHLHHVINIHLVKGIANGIFQTVDLGLQMCEHPFHSDERHLKSETDECDEQGVSRSSQRSPGDIGSKKDHPLISRQIQHR